MRPFNLSVFLGMALALALLLVISCGDDDASSGASVKEDDDAEEDDVADDDSEDDDDAGDDDATDDDDDDNDGPPYTYEQPEIITVFRSMDGRYPVYRIPALITTAGGTLLAFAEGRQGTNDHSKNDMVMRRSTDGGVTWEPHVVIADEGDNCLSDPLPVQIEAGPHAGRILFFYTFFPEGCHHSCVEPGYDGPKNSRNYMLYSDDDGLTWQGPVELTRSFRPEEVRYATGGPGFAIQKRLEPHAGRIILPFRQADPMEVLAVFSDDGGETWERGEAADDAQTEGTGNEVQMAEMPDGSLYLNSRSSRGTRHRKIARSDDGGETWTPLEDDGELVEPECMASVLQFSGLVGGDIPRLLYSGPNNSITRIFGGIRLSYDDGQTWPVDRIVWPGIFAYSVLTRIDCDTVGVLFEDNIWLHRLRLARFSIEWLTDGMDRPACD